VNSLEDRVRAAVHATAAEIGPGDVPPMRLTGTFSPQRHRRRGGIRRGDRHWAAPLAAAAAVVAVIAGAGLLGRASPSPAPKAAAAPAAPASHAVAAYPPNLVAGLTGAYVPATGAQYSAGALFIGEYKSLEGAVESRCMAGSGYRVPVPSAASIARTIFDLTQFPDLDAIARAGTLPGENVSGVVLPGNGSKAYRNALAHCSAVADALFKPMDKAARNVMNGWAPIVINIQSSAPVLATMPAVRACASRYGWPTDPYGPDRPIDSFAEFVDWVAGHLDGAGSRAASAAQMRALGVHWAPIFAQCARPAVTVMERLQVAAQRKFLGERQSQFARLVATARADFAAERRARG
jgi:hypothetical protein